MAQKPIALSGEQAQAFIDRSVPVPKTVSSLLSVQRHYRRSGVAVATEDESETIQVARFEVEPAEVSLELGVVVNMGDFETARVTVGMKVPCYYEERDGAYADAENFVKARLTKERDELVAWAKKRGAKNDLF
jgi:hypothetical protein